MKTLFECSILWFVTVWLSLFWISFVEANNVPHLAIRSEMRSLQAVNGRLNTQHLTVDIDVLTALALNRLEKVIIPVLEDDVIFHRTFQKIRKKSATWKGEDETGNTRILLTMGDGYFFARVISEDKTILFKPAGSDNQVVSYRVDKAFEVPLVDDGVTPFLESQEVGCRCAFSR